MNPSPGPILSRCADTKSEIVIPLMKNEEVFGVLDIDSPIAARFSKDDQIGLELFVKTLLKHI